MLSDKKLMELSDVVLKMKNNIMFNYDWAMYEEYGEMTEEGDVILRITKFNNGGKL